MPHAFYENVLHERPLNFLEEKFSYAEQHILYLFGFVMNRDPLIRPSSTSIHLQFYFENFPISLSLIHISWKFIRMYSVEHELDYP